MGDANGSIPTVQPVYGRAMWPAQSPAAAALASFVFVSQASLDVAAGGLVPSYGLAKRCVPVKGCRSITKRDMRWNDITPKMKVDPESYEVWADGVKMDVQPAETVALARTYNLF